MYHNTTLKDVSFRFENKNLVIEGLNQEFLGAVIHYIMSLPQSCKQENQLDSYRKDSYKQKNKSVQDTVSYDEDEDYVTGVWRGKNVRFKRIWGGHRFTDKEVRNLLSGQQISFEATSAKTGGTYFAEGKLANKTYKGKKFVGFEMSQS